MTRRARSKKVWPGVWSNTVCGHPAPGESFEAAIERRLAYELGMSVCAIDVVLPDHIYRAPAFRGIVEHELCPVFVARALSPPRANPDEVEDWRWVSWPEFVGAAQLGHRRRLLVVVQEPAARVRALRRRCAGGYAA